MNSTTQPILFFCHGNSFPASSYRKMLSALAQHFEIHTHEMFGHNPRFPVTNGWPHLLEELLEQLNRLPTPIILVGHSLGGILCAMAAQAQPTRIARVLLLEAPIVAGNRARILGVSKWLGIDKMASPARFSEKRRVQWASREHAAQHFSSKRAFAQFDAEALHDYVQAGMIENKMGVQLKFDRAIETKIYRTLPHHLERLLKHGLPMPVDFIGGTHSAESRMAGLSFTRKLCGHAHIHMMSGSHLLPFEKPLEVARMIEKITQKL